MVTLMFVLHEAPSQGRQALLQEARRLLAPDGELVLLDISPDYNPSPVMKSGEPYIEGYLANIKSDLDAAGFESVTFENPVPGRAGLWICKEPALKTIVSPIKLPTDEASQSSRRLFPRSPSAFMEQNTRVDT